MWDRCPTRSTNEPMRKSPQEPTGNGAPLWLRGPHTADSPRLRGPAEIASWKCEGDQSRKYRRINRRPLFTTGRQQAVRLSSRLPGDHVQTSCAQGEISRSQSGNPPADDETTATLFKAPAYTREELPRAGNYPPPSCS